MRVLSRLLLLACALAGGVALVTAASAEPPRRVDRALKPRIEAAFERQPELLAKALDKIERHRPGTRDVYFVGFAGFGDQDVFRKEVERVRELFDKRFGTKGRSAVLVNSPRTLTTHPMALVENLRDTLVAVGKRIDPKEDVVFVFVTSHGRRNSGAVVRLNGEDYDTLTPRRLAAALERSGIGQRIVLVSACFSGQFVDRLADDAALVMTAAAADRSSFGCTTAAEWTWFGQAYFVDALPKLGKFVPAFARARELVAAKEKRERKPASSPQISVGREIAKTLGELGL
jgi:hypothetical protein